MSLHGDYLELELPELAGHLLKETGQLGDPPANPAPMLEFLKLEFAVLDIGELLTGQKKEPRGVLSYSDRIVGVDDSLKDKPQRARFTTFHEVGHYVLPAHQQDLYICDEQDLSFETMIEVEKEANQFAAEILFKGDQFTREANDCDINPESIKTLALRYDASFEATAWRFAERNARPCSVAVFGPKAGSSLIDSTRHLRWFHRYTVSSAEFRTRYFRQLVGEVPAPIVKQLMVPHRDVADAISDTMSVESSTGDTHSVRVSFFTNHHCIFALIVPSNVRGS